MLLYAMQAGEYDNFDRIKQVNEQKEKHRRPDASKSADVQCTKNLLRNLNQTMLRFLQRSVISKRMMKEYFQKYENRDEEIEKFKRWAVSQKMDNFQQCRTLWTFNTSSPQFEYLYLFREIQFEFFSNSSCPAIFSSKVRNEESKRTHLKYIHAFLQGIKNPQLFTCFKKSGKLKEQEKNMEEGEEDRENKMSNNEDNSQMINGDIIEDDGEEEEEDDDDIVRGDDPTIEIKQENNHNQEQNLNSDGKQSKIKTIELNYNPNSSLEAQS